MGGYYVGPKEKLIEMDSIVGDGDLGLTMSDGFGAAYHAVSRSNETDIGKFFYLAGKTMSSAVPSTMGTLMASGLIEVGKNLKEKLYSKARILAAYFKPFTTVCKIAVKLNLARRRFLMVCFPQ